ncbi:MAG: ABC transporter ATP-binding protein [bacterium]
MTLLVVEALGVAFEDARGGVVQVVEHVDFHVERGESVALVGESGCGKSVTARALLGLLATARVTGRVRLAGTSVLDARPAELRRLRGQQAGFVFQDPGQALNPVVTVGEQIAERLRRHGGLDRHAAARRAVALLGEVGIPDPEARARAWPHQLSGGMRQRVVVAIALACDPVLLIADEPTTALDVTIQAQILALIRERQQARQMGLLLISHDLGVVAQTVDRVLVMYAGQIVEEAPVVPLFEQPRHPYTRGLLRSVPGRQQAGARLFAIPGTVPSPRDFPASCRFRARCDQAQAACEAGPVPLTPGGSGRVRCHFPSEAPA